MLHKCRNSHKFFSFIFVIISFLAFAGSAHAVDYYVATTGSDSNPGTQAAPWGSFSYAIPKLNPGDTLFLKNGIYNSSGHLIKVNCGQHSESSAAKNAKSGVAGSPITIKAESERQAAFHSDGDGDAIVIMTGCSHWTIEGLTFKTQDKDNGKKTVGGSFLIYHSDHIKIRRNLIYNSNRYNPNTTILLNYVNDSLVEENETYDYLGHVINNKYGDNNVFRRNYSNPRGRTGLGNYYDDGNGPGPSKPGALLTIYPGRNLIVENNIAEGTNVFVDTQTIKQTENIKSLGNISLNTRWHALLSRRPMENPGAGTVNFYFENDISVDPRLVGITARGSTNVIVNHFSVFGNSRGVDNYKGIVADKGARTAEFGVSPLPLSIHVKNSLITKIDGFANYFVDQDGGFSVDHTNLFNNSKDFYPLSSPTYTNNINKDPGLGSCKVFIPDSSPMKGAGTGGGDIGANILCRYENGTLTQTQLWNWETGQFPCGAIVPGVNNIAGSSCSDVHKRLNVNTNGCNLPATPSCKQPAPPNFPPIPIGGGGSGLPPILKGPNGEVCPSGF
ncbi:MAG: hypothetical protein ABL867_05955 [Rickettsiales bacterium]